jgi:hypothetical protein
MIGNDEPPAFALKGRYNTEQAGRGKATEQAKIYTVSE